MRKEITVPDIGNFKDVQVIEIFVKIGDTIKKDDPLITLESDKAAMEIPSTESGVIQSLSVKIGDKVSEGNSILVLEVVENTGKSTPVSTPEPVATAASAIKPITVPDIGNFKGVQLIEIFVKAGDTVKKDDPLVTLESDKAAMEIPCPESGIIQSLSVKIGDKVSQGDVLAMILSSDAALPVPPPSRAPEPVKTQVVEKTEIKTPPVRVEQSRQIIPHAGPAVRKMAREFGVDLSKVKGTGIRNRILKEDIQLFVKTELSKPSAPIATGGNFSLPEMPIIDFSQFGEIEQKSFSRIKKLSGPALHRSWLHIPHVTQFDDADITDLEDFRKSLQSEGEKRKVKLTLLAFLMKASVSALKTYPDFNASLSPDKESLILKKYFHLGFAADTPNGLVVPVVRNVDQKSLFDLAAEIGQLSQKARDGKLTPNEMQGGCFTISSLGGVGGTAFTPIINAPEVAILGVSKSQMKPVWQKDQFVPRLMLPLSLSYDHRVIDGAQAARFTTYLSFILADVRRLLI
jgi:pyruvate dehydrogenase E2 component (dihydrolipoamide acetyltransferase)